MDRLTQRAAPPMKRAYPNSMRNVAAGIAQPVPKASPPTASLIVGPTPNTVVVLDMQVMLRIAYQCSEQAPAIARGELVGLEVSPGILEVSNCYVTPPRKDLWNPRDRPESLKELEEKHKKEVEKFRLKVRELLHYVDADCQSVGWFQTMLNSAISDAAIVEQLYQRMVETDRCSVLLCFDLERSESGQFPFRAFHLSETYISLKRRQEAGDLSASNVVRTLSTSAIFSELRVEGKSVVADDALLLRLESANKRHETDPRHVQLSDQLDRGLKYLSAALEDFTAEGERLMKSQKESNRYGLRRVDRKYVRDDHRREQEDDEDGKKHEAPSHLKSLLVRGHVDSLATSVAQLAQENVAAGVLIAK
eukprot:Protomagalhaensia_wolfi_Nauph_80__1187@NODE_16_length_5045_cov_135_815621_g12_i0_p2_GENE_NODE_16_length_5045_cov_135_815621_g12_i0NODE_16_length_5045_cov_135_815621_g12_i0_p2_ORF_typecomplete_len364_score75_18JAB/PF01398_21/1_8e06_NODE_16_length_5045_cov_135_815621_g12_i09792070